MEKNMTYNFSVSMAGKLAASVEETGGCGDFSNFLSIRQELNNFLLNLNYSYRADGTGQQIHFLFIALDHLENVDREIRISCLNEEMISQEKIHGKIRSLKMLILNYIRQLTDNG